MSRRQLYPVNIANPATFTRCDLYGVYIYFIPRTPPYYYIRGAGARYKTPLPERCKRGRESRCACGLQTARNCGQPTSHSTNENWPPRARRGTLPTSRPKPTGAPRGKDGGNPATLLGSRYCQPMGAVGHTDEVNTTNRVTLFAGDASDSRPLLRVNPRKLNENPRKGKTDERTKHTKSGSEIDRRARRQGTAGNLHRGLRDTRDPASGKRPEAAPGDRRPCKARTGNRPGADRSTAAGPAVVSMRGRP